MAYPTDPLDVRVRLHLDGDWRDITDDVHWPDRIRIQYGRSPESRVTVPAQAWLTLNNYRSKVTATLGQIGVYSRRNAFSPWYGSLGRNTPIEIFARLLRDSYDDRTIAEGWGSVDGMPYSTQGAGGTVQTTDWSVSGGAARHSVPATSAYRESWLPDTSHKLIGETVTWQLPDISTVTGGGIEPANLLVRGQSAGDYYMVRVVITTSQTFTVALYRQGATVIAGPVTVPGLTYAAAGVYRTRVQADGWALRAKVWKVADGEPAGWHVSADTNWFLAAGFVGIRSGVATGNTNTKPIVFAYDELQLQLPRFAGEVSAWPTRWGHSEADSQAAIEVAGILRRLGQGASPLQSALEYYLDQQGSPVAHWPMDGGQLVESAPSTTPGVASLLPFVGAHPSGAVISYARWGAGDLAPWLPPGVSRTGSSGLSVLWAPVTMPSFAGTWTIDQLVNGGTDGLSGTVDINPSYLGGASAWPQLIFNGAGGEIGYTLNGAPEVFASVPQLYDGTVHHVRWTCTQSGSNVAVSVYVDDSLVLSGTVTTFTLPAITTIGLVADGGASFAQGRVGVWLSPPTLADLVDAVFGHRGEPAGERMQRLCQQEGIPLTIAGDPARTELMGPQQLAPLIEQVEHAAEVDGGPLGEQRSATGLAYRSRADLYNQAAALTLNYGTRGHVHVLQPADDDLLLRNDWSITRQDGGTARHELTSGPLSTQDPPDGVGRYDDSATLNVHTDTQAAQHAQWRVRLGTWDGDRYDLIALRLHALAGVDYDLAMAAAELAQGDRMVITGPPAWCGPDAIDQLAGQIVETLGEVDWVLEYRAAPAGLYQVLEVGHDLYGRIHPDGHTLSSGVSSSATSLSVATPTGGALWTTSAADLPLSILVGGERMTVTAISGASSPQTMTVTRSVNGVVKTHSAGAVLELTTDHRIGL